MPVGISIIMPSYLGEYRGAAKDRPAKFIRAVDSVLEQTVDEWELIIVSDGCDETARIYQGMYRDPRISCLKIPKQEMWSTTVRNIGLERASGEIVAYLDTDDYFGIDHLRIVRDTFVEGDWGWFNALFYVPRSKAFVERKVNINRCAEQGTCNIVHRRIDGLKWPDPPRNRMYGTIDYGRQDCAFIELLKKRPGVQLPTPQYMVGHVPGKYDV